MTDCPPKLRGDLSKWLCELDTGVYVGHVSSRVRDALWERICQNLKKGRATMVFSTNNEQKMDFRVHNTNWTPVDFDGICLMKRPLPKNSEAGLTLKPGFSKAAQYQMSRQGNRKKATGTFIVIDLETTGLHPATDEILEFGAIRVKQDGSEEPFHCLVRGRRPIPQQIQSLTGITDQLLEQQGIAMPQALEQFMAFIGRERLVGYHISFDLEFLRAECKRQCCPVPVNRCLDLLDLARREVDGVPDYKLATLAEYFSLERQSIHRALPDCYLALALYRKLNEPR